jgi:hypothetical protein
LNKDLEGKIGEIALADGSTIFAENIKISVDSSCWVEVKLSSGLWVPLETSRTTTWDIRRISYKNNAKGAWEWMGLGASIGIPIGALIGWQVTEGTHFYGGGSGEGFGILIGGLSGLLSGAIIGLPVGAGIGHKENYILIDSEN